MRNPCPDVNSVEISADTLKIPKAKELGAFLTKPGSPFARLLKCFQAGTRGHEVIIFQVEVELGQRKINDIRAQEPIAVIFDPTDKSQPEVLALRDDFPQVPHRNLRPPSWPLSLCLDEEPYDEQKLRWTAFSFVEKIRDWLRRTARGELHQEDQPLEPLLAGVLGTIILPHDFIGNSDAQKPAVILFERLNNETEPPIYRILQKPPAVEAKTPRAIATVFQTPSVQHGIIQTQPANLYELHEFCKKANYDLLAELSKRLHDWLVKKTAGDVGNSKLILIAVFPKKRHADTADEYREVWVFGVGETIHKTAVALGVEAEINGMTSVLINPGDKQPLVDQTLAEKVLIAPLKPVYTLSAENAALYNGFKPSSPLRIVAIGQGAIGSQVFNNIMRSGFGGWTLIDKDALLPHNCARHVLSGDFVGKNKAECLAYLSNETVYKTPETVGISADVLNPGDKLDALTQSFSNANAIIDFSASLAVARHLSTRIKSTARRIAVFLNPSGTDLIVLAEDAKREIPMGWLEMEYYRFLANDSNLSGHLTANGGGIRYARSCGDISGRLNQNLVALHAAIGSQVIRNVLEANDASITIFRADRENFTVNRYGYTPQKPLTKLNSGWTICYSPWLLAKLHALRKQGLPNETGGILIGQFDRLNRTVYVADALPSPKDSIEWPNLYIRGTHGLRTELNRIAEATMSNLEYIGEWHSHPPRCAPIPSHTDMQALESLASLMNTESAPAVMLIVADRNRHGFYLK